jgi:DNA-binding protein H-NS
MAKRELSKMTSAELEKLIAAAKAELESRKAKDGSVAEVMKLMDKLGITVDDIGGKPAKTSTRKPVEVKYRDPKNEANTWTGRGKRPKWLADAIASGKKLESFAI